LLIFAKRGGPQPPTARYLCAAVHGAPPFAFTSRTRCRRIRDLVYYTCYLTAVPCNTIYIYINAHVYINIYTFILAQSRRQPSAARRDVWTRSRNATAFGYVLGHERFRIDSEPATTPITCPWLNKTLNNAPVLFPQMYYAPRSDGVRFLLGFVRDLCLPPRRKTFIVQNSIHTLGF